MMVFWVGLGTGGIWQKSGTGISGDGPVGDGDGDEKSAGDGDRGFRGRGWVKKFLSLFSRKIFFQNFYECYISKYFQSFIKKLAFFDEEISLYVAPAVPIGAAGENFENLDKFS